ncbi:transglycosylase SLT domain-containing protein [Nocardioides zeicaulis]|uniref:transglycosylase SLT domain-containing protein n=1 Tax=Nocardioides zeicaulis TaxID=1776857 RepID=UPI0039F0C531
MLVAAAALAATLASPLAAPARADHADGARTDLPAGRTAVSYVVRPGDTATGLAVRFHAWTDELVALNHLGRDGRLTVGQRLVVPVVDARRGTTGSEDARGAPGRRHPDPGRERVRRAVADAARRHGVDPHLALAVAWQESGWQMDVVSDAHAVGAMQVLPSTARWMEGYAGRPLRLHRLRDNAAAGTLLLRVLARETDRRRHVVAAYYQGLGAVRAHGLYAETRTYVRNVEAIRRRLEEGRPPA